MDHRATMPLDQRPPSPLTIADVARILRCSPDTVRRHHAAWTRDAGFPLAVSLVGVRGLRWSSDAVLLWDLQRTARTAAANPTTGADGQAAIDWSAIAAARGALLDAGLDPDAVAINNPSVTTIPASV